MMALSKNDSKLSDQEIVLKLKEDIKFLGIVYEKCKSSSIAFLRKNGQKLKHIELEDIFSQSCYELYINFVVKNKTLEEEASLQTYLNKICLNQLRKASSKELDNNGMIKVVKKTLDEDGKVLQNEKNEQDDRNFIRNSNSKEINNEWLPDNENYDKEIPNDSQKNAIKKAFLKMKETGGHCAELLVLFWWRKRSMKELTNRFGYKNERVTIQQKAKCQKRLKKLMQKN